VTITYKQIGSQVAAGETIEYNGNCSSTGTVWTIDSANSTIDDKYEPKT
jgi:hypothetical protein